MEEDNLQQLIDQIKLDFEYDYDTTISHGATISQSASANTWPYTLTGQLYGIAGGGGSGTAGLGGAGSYTFTNNGSGGAGWDTWNTNIKPGSLQVRGDAEFEGDVKINGKSIAETLDKIEQRLAILHPNEKLEERWEELKKLGDAYRTLEKDIIEKEKIWETLKK